MLPCQIAGRTALGPFGQTVPLLAVTAPFAREGMGRFGLQDDVA